MITPRDLAQMMAKKSDQELLGMLASPDDWTAEALASARVELEKRGLDTPSERPPKTGACEDCPDIYEYFGTYSTGDARLLLDAFVDGAINYTLEVDKMGIQNMSAFQAANGGTFGAGVGVAIGVHANDCDEAMTIRQRVLKIVP
jgi:hypothetical protein